MWKALGLQAVFFLCGCFVWGFFVFGIEVVLCNFFSWSVALNLADILVDDGFTELHCEHLMWNFIALLFPVMVYRSENTLVS